MVNQSKENLSFQARSLIEVIEDLTKNLGDLQDMMLTMQFAFSVLSSEKVAKSIKTNTIHEFLDNLGRSEIDDHGRELLGKFWSYATMQRLFGNPYIYRQTTINLYTYLEAAIKDLIIAYFKNSEKIEELEQIGKLKISYFEFKKLNEDQKIEYLYEQYEKSITTNIKYGMKRFESLLEPIQLSGQTNKKSSDNIYELAQIRNNLLHRAGKADKKILKECPRLGLKLNQIIHINRDLYFKYHDAVSNYAQILYARVIRNEGIDVSNEIEKLTKGV